MEEKLEVSPIVTRPARHSHRRFVAYTRRDIDRIPQLSALRPDEITALKALSAVFPFRVNNYVVEELIDWRDVPDDPIYQLTFPQVGMLEECDFRRMVSLVESGAGEAAVAAAAREIQMRLNPHPGGQLDLNVPVVDGEPMPGMQHKYRETVLFFPSQGQTCHAYCTYCFRWAQFVGIDELKFAGREAEKLEAYVRRHEELRSVLITGGDPLIMRSAVLERYIEPLLGIEHVTSIRIGTKAPAYWPHRFLHDRDATDLLRLFEKVVRRGKHLALMAHYSHPIELGTAVARRALRRVRATGAVVRTQAPLIRRVNDSADVWGEMWREQVRLGAVPYYMFVERDTGARGYFEVPLARAFAIFRSAYRSLSGLERTARGPSMSANPGKVLLQGVTRVAGEKVMVLSFIQARDPSWVGRPFFAAYDPEATWLDELRPAFGEREFFFEPGLRRMMGSSAARPWLDEDSDEGAA